MNRTKIFPKFTLTSCRDFDTALGELSNFSVEYIASMFYGVEMFLNFTFGGFIES